MNKEFEESKHPRDKDGKFTSDGAKVYRQNTSYEYLTNTRENDKINLSAKEWAQFYVKLGEIERGGYVDKSEGGDKSISIGNKLVITSGTYEKPIVKKVIDFESEEELFDWIKRYKNGRY